MAAGVAFAGRIRSRSAQVEREHKALRPYKVQRLSLQHRRILLTDMPTDLLVHVLGFLPVQEVFSSECLVNRNMASVVYSRQYRSSVCELCLSQKSFAFLCAQIKSNSSPDNAFGKLVHSFPNLRRLEFNGCWQFDDRHLEIISKNVSRRLQSLTVDWCGGVSDNGIIALAKECPALTDLSIFKGRMSASSETAKCSITDRSLVVLKESCSNLNAVYLAYTQMTRKGIESFAQQTNLQVNNLIELGHAASWGPTSASLVSKALVERRKRTITYPLRPTIRLQRT